MSVADFVATLAPTPDWLKDIQAEARQRGLDQLTMDEIDAEIDEARRGEVRDRRLSGAKAAVTDGAI